MDNMRDLRARMRSVRQSLQMTTAMKLISTSKLRKARRRLEDTLPYFEGIRTTMAEIIARSGLDRGRWFTAPDEADPRRCATLVITADRGLAGGYNNSIIRYVEENTPHGSMLMPIGFVGKRTFAERNYVFLADFPLMPKEPSIANAREIANLVVRLYNSGEIDRFRVVFTRMVSMVKQTVEEIDLLPLSRGKIVESESSTRPASMMTFIPDEETLLDLLVPAYLKGIIYGALIESFACEQAARMTAMESSSKNAKDMLDRLQLLYNRARQGAITAEVSEIVAGAAALNG
ncbi:MAG: ATP synthase F1 subunit gamma [Rectinemataceae bacterium]